jgi:hypothetical protein
MIMQVRTVLLSRRCWRTTGASQAWGCPAGSTGCASTGARTSSGLPASWRMLPAAALTKHPPGHCQVRLGSLKEHAWVLLAGNWPAFPYKASNNQSALCRCARPGQERRLQAAAGGGG